MKDKKVIIIGAVSAAIVLALIFIFMPSGQQSSDEHEVISKRAKLTEETVEEAPSVAPAAPVESSAPVEPVVAAAPAEPAPIPAVKEAPASPTVERKKTVEGAPVKKTVENERKTTKAAKASQPRKPETKEWAINVASFASLPEAQNLAISLRKAGYKSYIADFTRDSVKWHRVRVGFFSTRADAEKSGREIQSKFRVDTPWIVKPESAELKSHM